MIRSRYTRSERPLATSALPSRKAPPVNTTVRSRIAIAMTALVLANAVGAVFSWWAYGEAARYSADARAASRRAALASAAAERVTAWSADTGTLAFAAREAKRSEDISGPYGNVLGSELAATGALRRLDAQFGSDARPLTGQWEELRLLTYLWVNSEAIDGGTDIRLSRMSDGRIRASSQSNLVAPQGFVAQTASEFRATIRQRTEALKDGTLRNLVVSSEQDAVEAAVAADEALALARNGTIATLLFVLVLAVGASIWLYRSIARPLTSARDFADKVAGGDWTATYTLHRSDEIGALTHAVENMKDAFVRKATIMSEMAGAVLVTSGQVDAAAKHAQQTVASGEISPTALAEDLAAVSARTETLTGLAAQMLQD